MNKKIIFLIILPVLFLSSCNETTAEDFSKFLLTYEDFKNVIKEKDYKTLIKDGKYLYSESIVSDNMSTLAKTLHQLEEMFDVNIIISLDKEPHTPRLEIIVDLKRK